MDIQYYQNLLKKEMEDYISKTTATSVVVQAVLTKALKNCKSTEDVDAYNVLLTNLLRFGQQNNMPHFEQLYIKFKNHLAEYISNGLNANFPNFSNNNHASDTGKSPEQIKNTILTIYNFMNGHTLQPNQLNDVLIKLKECETFLEELGRQVFSEDDFKKLYSMVGSCSDVIKSQMIIVDEIETDIKRAM